MYKHMKNFITKDRSRPCFNCVCFDADKAVATDTHVLAVAKGLPLRDKPYFEPLLENVDMNDLAFPDYKRVLPKSEPRAKYVLQESGEPILITSLMNIFKFLKSYTGNCVITCYDSSLWAYAENELEESVRFRLIQDSQLKGLSFTVSYSTDYLFRAFSFFRDLHTKGLTMKWFDLGNLLSLTLESEDLLVYILPIRNNTASPLLKAIEADKQREDDFLE